MTSRLSRRSILKIFDLTMQEQAEFDSKDQKATLCQNSLHHPKGQNINAMSCYGLAKYNFYLHRPAILSRKWTLVHPKALVGLTKSYNDFKQTTQSTQLFTNRLTSSRFLIKSAALWPHTQC